METCRGEGECIVSKSLDGFEMSCEHNCKPRSCLNSLVCNSTQENAIMVTGGNLCFTCDIAFRKTLTILEKVNCPLCLEKQVQGVQRLDCEHYLCISCFKKAHFGSFVEPRPTFPYPNQIELDIADILWDPEWKKDLLLLKYAKDTEEWETRLYAAFLKDEQMRECDECITE